MNTQHYDVIVVGVGGMGSAALYQLARRGLRVLGIERFDIPNDKGSSHGVTRIIRLAYYEHPSYVPLMRRAYELWRDFQREANEQVLHVTGSIDAGPPGSQVFEGSLASCLQHDLPHQVLTSADLTRRFPGYRLPPDTMAVLQPDGGFLLPERCIEGCVRLAEGMDADVHRRERVLDWQPLSDGIRVRTDRGRYEAASLVITAGAWASKLVPELATLAVPERQVLAWFHPLRPELFTPDRFPVFNLMVEEGRYYGFPAFGVPGFKVGRYHHLGELVDPDAVSRDTTADDEAVLRDFTRRCFPDAAGPAASMKVCMFTNSPDEHFILDLLPGCPQVSIAAGFSGHGFKFCSVVGEIMADFATELRTRHDIAMFRLGRFPTPAEPI